MFRKLLVPVDLDVESSWTATLPLAEDLAAGWGAEIHVLTVVPDFGMSLVASYFPKGFEKKSLELASETLKAVVARTATGKVEIRTHVTNGAIYEEILHFADWLECDLIVMTSHRPELKDYLLGPNAARVTRHARQSVFVVRER